jgi:hypothetical protein
MKTPREILLARHKAVESKLDDIRQNVIGKLNNQETKEQSFFATFVSLFLGCSKNFWNELILPSRRIWAGLAAIWFLLLAINFSMRDHTPVTMAKSTAPEMAQSFKQQEQLLTELIGPDESIIAEPQKTYKPRPSSQRSLEILIT